MISSQLVKFAVGGGNCKKKVKKVMSESEEEKIVLREQGMLESK